jgi:hypothetical protein
MTKFSLPATLGGEVSVTLRGDPALAIDGYPLKKKSGVWQGAACVPLDAGGTYYYELAFPGEQEDGGTLEGDAGLFITQRYNPKQPTASSSTFGTVNVIAPKSSCN